MRRPDLGLLIALTALAAAGRLLLLAVPNVSLTFLVVAVAGLAYGPRMGAAVGFLAMLLTSLALGGLGPGALAGAAATGLLGALAGALRATGFPGPRRTPSQAAAAAGLGAGMQLAFSAAADAAAWALFAGLPQGAQAVPLLAPLVLAGLAFNALPALVQAMLFAAALQPVLHALRAAGLAEEPRGLRGEGRGSVGGAADGEAAEGQAAEGQAAEGQAAEGQAAEGQAAEGQAAETGAPLRVVVIAAKEKGAHPPRA